MSQVWVAFGVGLFLWAWMGFLLFGLIILAQRADARMDSGKE